MQYACRLGTADGRVIEEVHHSADAEVLRGELERKGLHVFEIQPRGVLSRISLTVGSSARPVNMRSLLLFNQELAALLKAGLPLLQALDLVLERQRDPQLLSILREVRDQVKSGAELSTAFAAFGDQFPPLYPSTLKAGESSGEMEAVIRRFIRYQRLVMEARKKVVSALMYPAVLIALAFVLIGVMTVFVVPRFTVFYDDLNAELPMLTKMTLFVSHFARDNWLLVLIALAATYFFVRQWKRTPAGAITIDRLKLRLPIVGSIFHRMSLSEFGRAISTLLTGGIPLLAALETGVQAVGNRFMSQSLRPTIQSVREGSSLWAALEATGEASDVLIDMVKVGEATGSLDAMLNNVADFYDEETDTDVQRIVGLIEPIMLIFMGVIIATLLLSVYLPLFGALGQVPS